MRGFLVPVLVVLLATPFAGCIHAVQKEPIHRLAEPARFSYDPRDVVVSSVTREPFTLASFDNTTVAGLAYVPHMTGPLPDGSIARFPVILFLHGWGGAKEDYESHVAPATGIPTTRTGTPADEVNRLQEFASAGFIAVAYDARGFGASGGAADVDGPGEQADFSAVLDHVVKTYPTSGLVGVIGQSYGAGGGLLAWANEPRVTTAMVQYGWADLYQGLLPGNVPKLEWGEALFGYGLVGSKARYSPTVTQWFSDAHKRENLDVVRRQMEERSVASRLPHVNKPLFLCQGLQESLFPQANEIWDEAAGFTRAYLYVGGHASSDAGCWNRTMQWAQFFLQGFDTQVDSWPALVTPDALAAADAAPVQFAAFPAGVRESFFLRDPDLAASASPQAQFTIKQQGWSNPGAGPGGLWDKTGLPNQPIPAPITQDPTAVVFTSQPLAQRATLVGEPVLHLHLAKAAQPFQVTSILAVDRDGSQTIVSRGAFAASQDSDIPANGVVDLRLHWSHARLAEGDKLVLKVDANDASWFMPYPADYTVTFDGVSRLDVPLVEGP